MNQLSPTQRLLVRQLMNAGCAHAARAFSQVVNQKVDYNILHLTTSEREVTRAVCHQPDRMTLVLTDMMGEVGGRSYLLFSEQERAALQEMCLPAALNARQRMVMGDAVLKEIDNIVTAAVVTKLSESLNLRIFGGVPHLLYLPTAEMQKKLYTDFAQATSDSLFVSMRFLFEDNRRIQPQFFWKFPLAFFHHLADYSPVNYQNTSR